MMTQSLRGAIHSTNAFPAPFVFWLRSHRGAVTMAGLLAFYLYLRQTTALKLAGERQQQVLQKERDLLERQVRERTASLAELATHEQ